MIAEGLALFHGWRVLAVDLDPQASLTAMMLSSSGADAAAEKGRSITNLLSDLASGRKVTPSRLISTKVSDVIQLRDAADSRRVDLLASDRRLLEEMPGLELQLRKRLSDRLDVALAVAMGPVIDRLAPSYDAIIFDCPAGNQAIGIAALYLSRVVLSPTTLDPLSLKVLGDFRSFLKGHRPPILERAVHRMVPTIYRANDPEHRTNLDHMRAGLLAIAAIDRPIPQTTILERASVRIGPASFRTAREKYDAMLSEVAALSDEIVRLSMELAV